MEKMVLGLILLCLVAEADDNARNYPSNPFQNLKEHLSVSPSLPLSKLSDCDSNQVLANAMKSTGLNPMLPNTYFSCTTADDLTSSEKEICQQVHKAVEWREDKSQASKEVRCYTAMGNSPSAICIENPGVMKDHIKEHISESDKVTPTFSALYTYNAISNGKSLNGEVKGWFMDQKGCQVTDAVKESADISLDDCYLGFKSLVTCQNVGFKSLASDKEQKYDSGSAVNYWGLIQSVKSLNDCVQAYPSLASYLDGTKKVPAFIKGKNAGSAAAVH